jgi:hypothetical protein
MVNGSNLGIITLRNDIFTHNHTTPPPVLAVQSSQLQRNKKVLYALLEKFVARSPTLWTGPPGLYISAAEQEQDKAAIDAALDENRVSYPSEIDLSSAQIDVLNKDKTHPSPPGIATLSELMARNVDALNAVLQYNASLPTPDPDASSVCAKDNKQGLATTNTNLRAPLGIAVSPELLMRNTNVLESIFSDSPASIGSQNGGVALDALYQTSSHHFDGLYHKDRHDSVHEGRLQVEEIVRSLRALLRPKNAAEIRLMKLTNSGTFDLEFTSRRRTKEELLLNLIQQRSAFVYFRHVKKYTSRRRYPAVTDSEFRLLWELG